MSGKILYLVESISSGGAERQLVILMNGLIPLGYEVHLITWVNNNHYDDSDISGVNWVKLQRKSILDLSFIYELIRYTRTNKIQVVHGFLDNGNLYAATLKLFLPRIKCFLSERSSHRPLSFLRGIYKRIIHGIPSIITVCNSEAGESFVKQLSLLPAKTKVIRNGFDLNRFRPATLTEKQALRSDYGYNQNSFIILMVGRIIPLKRPLEVVVAFQEFYSSFPEARLIILGDGSGDYKEELISQVNSHTQSSGSIEIIPAVKNVEDYYKLSDLYIHNSEREGSPNTLVEAMASGQPVLAANAGDIAYYVNGKQFPYWINEGKPAQLRSYLMEFGRMDESSRSAIGLNNSRRIHEELPCGFSQLVQNHLLIYGL